MDALTVLLPAIDPVLTHSAAAFVGTVLLIAAIEKLRDPDAFRDAVENYQVLPGAVVPAFARAVPLLEVLAGAMLLPVASRQTGAWLALALWLMFTAAIVLNLRRGRDRIDCGCGGSAHTPLGKGLVLRNVALMLATWVAAAPMLGRSTVWLDIVAVSFATLFLLGLHFLVNTMLSHQSRLLDLRNSP